jgi:hypothetical protein
VGDPMQLISEEQRAANGAPPTEWPSSHRLSSSAARRSIEGWALLWEERNGGPKPFTRITLAKRIASKNIPDKVWLEQEVGKAISLLLDQAEAIE